MPTRTTPQRQASSAQPARRDSDRRPFIDSARLLASAGKPEDKAMSLVMVSGVGLAVFAGLVYLAVYAC
jgi:hypothetical protein